MLHTFVNYDVCGCLYVQYKYNITLYNLIIKKLRWFFYMCVYCCLIIINFCNKVSKIQENNCKVNDCSSI